MQQFFPASMRHYTVTSTAVVPAAAFSAWLRRMLACNLADAMRALGREKRDVARRLEVGEPLEAPVLDG